MPPRAARHVQHGVVAVTPRAELGVEQVTGRAAGIDHLRVYVEALRCGATPTNSERSTAQVFEDIEYVEIRSTVDAAHPARVALARTSTARAAGLGIEPRLSDPRWSTRGRPTRECVPFY